MFYHTPNLIFFFFFFNTLWVSYAVGVPDTIYFILTMRKLKQISAEENYLNDSPIIFRYGVF